MKMNYKVRLKQYIKEGKIYNDWLDKNLSYVSDFDRFCIQHCKDIEELLKENLKLEQALDEIEKYLEGAGEMACYSKSMCLYEENIEDILEIIQKAKGDVNNENNNI